MPIEDFCCIYRLQDSVLTNFTSNSYTDAGMLRFLTIKELETMNFMLGNIAAVRMAVEKWAL